MTDNARIAVHDIMDDWELDEISNLDDIEDALIEAFMLGATLGEMDSVILNEARDYMKKRAENE